MWYLISLHVTPCWGWYIKFIVSIWAFYIFSCMITMRCDKATHLPLLFKSALSVRLRANLYRSEYLLISQFINLYHIIIYISLVQLGVCLGVSILIPFLWVNFLIGIFNCVDGIYDTFLWLLSPIELHWKYIRVKNLFYSSKKKPWIYQKSFFSSGIIHAFIFLFHCATYFLLLHIYLRSIVSNE